MKCTVDTGWDKWWESSGAWEISYMKIETIKTLSYRGDVENGTWPKHMLRSGSEIAIGCFFFVSFCLLVCLFLPLVEKEGITQDWKETKFKLIKANNFHSTQNWTVKFTSRRNIKVKSLAGFKKFRYFCRWWEYLNMFTANI